MTVEKGLTKAAVVMIGLRVRWLEPLQFMLTPRKSCTLLKKVSTGLVVVL